MLERAAVKIKLIRDSIHGYIEIPDTSPKLSPDEKLQLVSFLKTKVKNSFKSA